MSSVEPLHHALFPPAALALFSQAERQALQSRIRLHEIRGKPVPMVTCVVRDKDIQLKPEEVVRQLFAARLLQDYQYPKARIQFEYPVSFGREKKSADIVVFDKDLPDAVYMVVETKKPKLKDGKDQLKSYCHATGAPIAVWTNGRQISFYHRKDPNYFEDIPGIPSAREKLSDILTERWTIKDLRCKDKLVTGRKSLKSLIQEMEDEVLANAGVDVFEELFKLIFTKLYDEMRSGRDSVRHLEFRNYGDTETELKAKIHALFQQAKSTWEGVFTPESKIELTAAHLSICVASLQDVKLFNSNLEVIDEAFEYLISKSSKGEKGQYFTPRYVIDMCVKMLNPQAEETLIDTAAGSCGFPVHSIFHVWESILQQQGLGKGSLFGTEAKPAACVDYVSEKVFAIDFDEKAVRVARTLNLIAGDGQTNVLHLNTLDWQNWDRTTRDDQTWVDTYNNGWKKLRRLQREPDSYRSFAFDILMANPPFAGDIKQSAMLSQYELAKNAKGKLQSKVGRDILFIERNLNFLKSGGRMAIVLPQGRFNNVSDAYMRQWLSKYGRILAVVGLHGNVFKPHTGTKTSVLFFQKWHETLCPPREDYPIFFATMQKPSKDNSGEKIYLKDENGNYRLDTHGHLVVDHDLYNHEGMTGDGIAEAFMEFAKREKLSFFLSSENEFKEEYYGTLLNKLEINEVLLSEADKEKRMDAEYHQKKYRSFFKGVTNHKPLNHFIREGYRVVYENTKTLGNPSGHDGKNPFFLQATDIETPYINTHDLNHVDRGDWDQYPKGRIVRGELLVEVKGMLKKAALVPEDFPEYTLVSGSLFKISVNGKINKKFLLVYLISAYGDAFKQRYKTNLLVSYISKSDLYRIPVPIFSEKFQKKISELYDGASISKTKADREHALAHEQLLAELDLTDYQPDTNNIAIRNFKESFEKTGRLDAEYYQPRYEYMAGIIKNYPCGYKTLGQCAQLIKGFEVGADAYQETGIPFVRVSNLSPFGLSEEKYIAPELYETLPHCQPEQHDILLSKDATPGIACYLADAPKRMVISGGILRLQKTTPVLNYESLALLLNSILVQEQIRRDAGGSVILHWRPDQIRDTRIPIIPETLQNTLANHMGKARRLRQQSQTLLDQAKTAMELAIENGEARALEFLNTHP